MTESGRHAVQRALRLGGLGLIAVLLLEAVFRLSAPAIEESRRQRQREALALALPATLFDNPIEDDRIDVRAPRWLGDDSALAVHRGRRLGAPAGLVIEARAADGYGGPIHLLVGVDASGRVQGVRLTEHRETPGLGDYVDPRRSNWARQLSGRALGDPPLAGWRLRRDGGEFSHVAGATLSPRAVVGAVRRVLQFADRHAESLYAAPQGSRLDYSDGPEPVTPR